MRVNEYYFAKSVEDAFDKLHENPKNSLIAGGLWMKKTAQSYETLIDLSRLGLDKIEDKGSEIHVGALTTLRAFEESPLINSLNSGATAFGVREIMGVQFRNMATIGGSVFGRYPFSDVIASLLVLDVKLHFYPEATLTLEEYLSYKGKYDGILTHIIIKKEESKGYFKKVKTTALDFPLVNISISHRNKKFYIAVGSRPMLASLCHKAMDYMNSLSSIEEEDFKKAAEIAASELTFADSNNISKQYREDLTRVYVRRGLKEVY